MSEYMNIRLPQIPCFQTTEATNPFFLYLPHVLQEYANGNSLGLAPPHYPARFNPHTFSIEYDIQYMHKHKTNYIGLQKDPLYTRFPSGTLYIFSLLKLLKLYKQVPTARLSCINGHCNLKKHLVNYLMLFVLHP
jgi:hypothetical protein